MTITINTTMNVKKLKIESRASVTVKRIGVTIGITKSLLNDLRIPTVLIKYW